MSKDDGLFVYRDGFNPSNVFFFSFRVIDDDQSTSNTKTKFIPAVARPFSAQYSKAPEILFYCIIYLSEQLSRIAANAFEDYFFAPQTTITVQLKKCLLVMKNEGVHIGKRRLFKP